MNEVETKVLHRFVELLLLHPKADIKFLWVQAGGTIASQQSVHLTGLGLCEEEGCKKPAVVGYCDEHF